jgi:hypothetical protein
MRKRRVSYSFKRRVPQKSGQSTLHFFAGWAGVDDKTAPLSPAATGVCPNCTLVFWCDINDVAPTSPVSLTTDPHGIFGLRVLCIH